MISDRFYLAIFVIGLVYLLSYVYILFNPDLALLVSALVYPPTALIPVLTYLPSMKKLGFSWDDKFSVMVLFQWIASIFWFLGELIWCWYYNLYLNVENPYPSIADVFYVLGYIPSIVGLGIYVYVIYKIVSPELSTRKKILGLGTALLIGSIVSWVYWYMTVLSYEGEPIPPNEFVLNGLYVLFDGLLVVIVVLGFLVIRGKLGVVLFLFLVSSILSTAYDVFFAYLEALDLYFDGHPSELLELYSYLIDGVAFYEVFKMARS